jgi:uncharacterized protein YecE (DUF72 family)
MKPLRANNPFPPNLLIGTDGWNWDDWKGVLYPKNVAQADYLAEYAKHFPIVEVDATFYRIPKKEAVKKWREQTPNGFLFAVKVPRGVTHTGFSGDYQKRLAYFLEVMRTLGNKLGPILFQFPYYRESQFASAAAFVAAFEPILASLPQDLQFAVEVRNADWVGRDLIECLRRHNAAFVLVDPPWARQTDVLMEKLDVVTADFCYIRWLGDRRKIAKLTEHWDRLVIEKTEMTSRWVKILKNLLDRDVKTVYGVYSNRYAGCAPGSIELLRELWKQEEGI